MHLHGKERGRIGCKRIDALERAFISRTDLAQVSLFLQRVSPSLSDFQHLLLAWLCSQERATWEFLSSVNFIKCFVFLQFHRVVDLHSLSLVGLLVDWKCHVWLCLLQDVLWCDFIKAIVTKVLILSSCCQTSCKLSQGRWCESMAMMNDVCVFEPGLQLIVLCFLLCILPSKCIKIRPGKGSFVVASATFQCHWERRFKVRIIDTKLFILSLFGSSCFFLLLVNLLSILYLVFKLLFCHFMLVKLFVDPLEYPLSKG